MGHRFFFKAKRRHKLPSVEGSTLPSERRSSTIFRKSAVAACERADINLKNKAKHVPKLSSCSEPFLFSLPKKRRTISTRSFLIAPSNGNRGHHGSTLGWARNFLVRATSPLAHAHLNSSFSIKSQYYLCCPHVKDREWDLGENLGGSR